MSGWAYCCLMVGWWLLTFAAITGTSGSVDAGLLAVSCVCFASVLGAGFADAKQRDDRTEETP